MIHAVALPRGGAAGDARAGAARAARTGSPAALKRLTPPNWKNPRRLSHIVLTRSAHPIARRISRPMTVSSCRWYTLSRLLTYLVDAEVAPAVRASCNQAGCGVRELQPLAAGRARAPEIGGEAALTDQPLQRVLRDTAFLGHVD